MLLQFNGYLCKLLDFSRIIREPLHGQLVQLVNKRCASNRALVLPVLLRFEFLLLFLLHDECLFEDPRCRLRAWQAELVLVRATVISLCYWPNFDVDRVHLPGLRAVDGGLGLISLPGGFLFTVGHLAILALLAWLHNG